jgi:hypothetical protein
MSRTDAEVTRAAEQTAETVLRLIRERDHAREWAVTLEAQVAEIAALADWWETSGEATYEEVGGMYPLDRRYVIAALLAALEPTP